MTNRLALRLIAGLTMSLTTASALADISVEQGYVRATPPGVTTGAAFLTLHNSDNQPVALKRVTSPIASNPELHQHIEHDGMMQMRKVDAIEVPPNGSVSLQPGGYHIMLLGLKGALKEGDEVVLMLEFSDGQSTRLALPVKKIRSAQAMPKVDHADP
jgi:hypothetical protein